MQRYISLIFLMTAFLAMGATTLKGKIVRDDNQKGIPNASYSVEYVDTIETFSTDRKGGFKFSPRSFPITITVQATDMKDATIGFISKPDKPIVIKLTPMKEVFPTKRPDWSSAMRPRLSSSYIVIDKPSCN